jgi:prevent-host-death family protein
MSQIVVSVDNVASWRYISAMAVRRPRSVGLRELKNRLSEYVRLVRAGERLQVTDRGHVVAEVLPPGASGPRTRHPGLAELERRGLLRPARIRSRGRYPLLPRCAPPGTAQRLLDAERGER